MHLLLTMYIYKQAVPINGDNIHHSDHNPPYPEMFNKESYFAVIVVTRQPDLENDLLLGKNIMSGYLIWLLVKTSTNRNVDKQNIDKPKRRRTETSTNQNVDKPKRQQTEMSTDQNVNRPKRRQPKMLTNQNGDKPKRRQSIKLQHYSYGILYILSIPIS